VVAAAAVFGDHSLTMVIDLRRFDPDGIEFDEAVRLPELPVDVGPPVRVVHARLRGTAERGERGVDFRARFDARVRLSCSRCLEAYETDLGADVELTLVAEAVEVVGDDLEMSEQDALLFHGEDGKVHLDAIAREQVYLNLPLKPVCRDDCRGLCPTCGENRNRLECGCRAEAIDPRLAPLLDFTKRRGGS
jgi:uncharacterized protein